MDRLTRRNRCTGTSSLVPPGRRSRTFQRSRSQYRQRAQELGRVLGRRLALHVATHASVRSLLPTCAGQVVDGTRRTRRALRFGVLGPWTQARRCLAVNLRRVRAPSFSARRKPSVSRERTVAGPKTQCAELLRHSDIRVTTR